MKERLLFSPYLLGQRQYRERKTLDPRLSDARKRYSLAGYVWFPRTQRVYMFEGLTNG